MKIISLAVFLFLSCGAFAQNISTIAGGGPHDLNALQIGAGQIYGLSIDTSGNLYLSARSANEIWKVDSSSNVNIFAGNGAPAFSGDSGQASAASFYAPLGSVFDSAGNLYVADNNNCRIRKISTALVITTIAGNGTCAYGGELVPAASSSLNYPSALAIDSSNNLYFIENGSRVREITSTQGTLFLSTIAGNGTAGAGTDGGSATASSLNNPQAIALDSSGTLYIADTGNNRLRKVSGGTITTIAGTGTSGTSGDGGMAVAAQLLSVQGVAVDVSGNVYLSDGNRVREIAASTQNIATVAGSTSPGFVDGAATTVAGLSAVTLLVLDSTGSTLYIVDAGNSRIKKLAAGTVTTIVGNGTAGYTANGPAATNVNFLTSYSGGLALDGSGSILFDELAGSAIRRVSLSSGALSTLAGNGLNASSPDGSASTSPVNYPFGIGLDSTGAYYFIESNRVRKISGGVYSTVVNSSNAAGFSGDGGPAISATMNSPINITVAPNGDLYIPDLVNNRVRMVTAATGIITTIAGNGSTTSSGDGGLATSASVFGPAALSLDGAGNLFIAEKFGNRIRKVVLSSNIITTVASNGSTTFSDNVAATSTGLNNPYNVFADQSSDLFIADFGNNRVRKVTAATGIITTVAGNGSPGFSGDGGPAVSAALVPYGVIVDRGQNLYVSDYSGRIRTLPVLACFFTVSAPTVYFSKDGGTGSVTVSATDSSCPYTVSSSSASVTITSAASGTGSGTVTFSVSADPGTNRISTVSFGGQTFTIAQAGVLGQSNVGYFTPSIPQWALDANGNGGFDSGDKLFTFAGQPGAIAVVGDWNHDGRSKIGYYLNGFWALDYDGDGVFTSADKFYAFGASGSSYIPVVGDWNGDGRTKIGYYLNGFWTLDYNGDGTFTSADKFYAYGGNAGEVPLVGDWNGDRRTKIGFFYNGLWVLDYNGDGAFDIATDKYYNNFSYLSGDKPVIGDWSNSGTTKIGIFRGGFWVLDNNGNGTYDGTGTGQDKFYAFGGGSGDAPVVGDWNADGRTKVGLYNSGFWTLDFNGNGLYDGTGTGGDRFIAFGGAAGNQPLIGRW